MPKPETMGQSVIDDLKELKDATKEYTDAQIHYFKLQLVENLSLLFSRLISNFTVVFLALFAILLFSMSLSFFMGDLLNSNALGFLIGGGVFIILMITFYFIKKSIIDKPVIQSFLRMFFPDKILDTHDEEES